MLVSMPGEPRIVSHWGEGERNGELAGLWAENKIVPKCLNSSLGSSPPIPVALVLPSCSLPTASHCALPTPTTGFGLREG